MLTTGKMAEMDYPVHELIARRWSPYAFDDRPVSQSDLRSLFEAALGRLLPTTSNRGAISLPPRRSQSRSKLSCLVEANQAWAKRAPVLALGVVSRKFGGNGRDNRAAIHDLGLAAGNLVFEATARSLAVHQMIGILPDKARETYDIPQGQEVWTALAIGY
jgi:nitroreductase